MASIKKISAEYHNKNEKHNVKIHVFTWNEDNMHYAYSPALDITGYGNDEKAAIKSFEVTFQEFVKYTTNKKTLFDELEHLGWAVNRKKHKMHAPNTEELLKDNETFRDIYKKPGVRMQNKDVELAVA